MVLLIILSTLVTLSHAGETSLKKEGTITSATSDKDTFLPYLSINVDGGYFFILNKWYKERLTNGPCINLSSIFYPYFLKNISEGVSIQLDMGYIRFQYKNNVDSTMNIFTLGTSLRYSKQILFSNLSVYSALGGGYYLSYFNVPQINEKSTPLNPYAKLQAGITFTFYDIHQISLSGSFTGLYEKTDVNYGASAQIAYTFRFGEDLIPPLDINKPIINSLFIVQNPLYAKKSVGSVEIVNSSNKDMKNIKISVMINNYMSIPTTISRTYSLKAGQKESVELTTIFDINKSMLLPSSKTQAEIKVSYQVDDRKYMKTTTVPVEIYDIHSIVWDDSNKVGSFIIVEDNIVRDFASNADKAIKNNLISSLNDKLQSAMAVFEAIILNKISYVSDPNTGYSVVGNKSNVVDTIQFARETLETKSGDCDDLTVLYCSLLESIGIQTGFITVPGHIFVMFNTEVDDYDYLNVSYDENLLIFLEGKVWIPVEITALNKGFLEAWEIASNEYNKYKNNSAEIYITSNSKEKYPAIGLPKSNEIVKYDNQNMLPKNFSKRLSEYVSWQLDIIKNINKNKYGKDLLKYCLAMFKAYLHFSMYDETILCLNKAIELDENNYLLYYYIAKMYVNTKDYNNALKNILIADKKKSDNAFILYTLYEIYTLMDNKKEANITLNKALAIDPNIKEKVKNIGF